MEDLANQSRSPAKLTRLQLIAASVLAVEFCLVPLVPVVFIFARPLSNIVFFASSPNVPLMFSFLRDQYEFLLNNGVDQSSAMLFVRLFEFFILVLIPIVLLRLILAPLLFGLIDCRKILERRGISIIQLSIAWLLMAIAIWASIDIRGSSSLDVLSALLKYSPQGYIFLEAFVLVGASILFVEELLILLDLSLKRAPSQSSQARRTD